MATVAHYGANGHPCTMQLIRNALFTFLSAGFALAAGCKAQEPMVYVLASEQAVTLTPSVSATQLKQGEQIVLRVQRRAVGEWKQIPRNQLTPGQCWLYTPPPEMEQEVADNVEWEVVPEEAIRFEGTFRMDHTRIGTVVRTGTIVVRPRSPVRCEKDRVVEGPALKIKVA
jgi:hypothetical protein